eukprot:761356-Hanusia_phi.AAC.4
MACEARRDTRCLIRCPWRPYDLLALPCIPILMVSSVRSTSLIRKICRRERLRRLRMSAKSQVANSGDSELSEGNIYFFVPSAAYNNRGLMKRVVFHILCEESNRSKSQKLKLEVERLQAENVYYKNVNEALVNHIAAKNSEPPSVMVDDLGNVKVIEQENARNLNPSPLNSPILHAKVDVGPKIELSKRSPHDLSHSLRKHGALAEDLKDFSDEVLQSLEYIFGEEAIAKRAACEQNKTMSPRPQEAKDLKACRKLRAHVRTRAVG